MGDTTRLLIVQLLLTSLFYENNESRSQKQNIRIIKMQQAKTIEPGTAKKIEAHMDAKWHHPTTGTLSQTLQYAANI